MVLHLSVIILSIFIKRLIQIKTPKRTADLFSYFLRSINYTSIVRPLYHFQCFSDDSIYHPLGKHLGQDVIFDFL